MVIQSKIAVIGASSRLGKAILESVPASTTGFSRSISSQQNHVMVSDYHRISPGDLEGAATIINCAGLRDGSSNALHQANVALPAILAKAARAAGARRFVHVSSFSVHGHAERIGFDTPAAPSSPYGYSKQAGDEALLALNTSDFAVMPVRLPAIIGSDRPNDKINRLLAIWRRLPAIPVSSRKVNRAMISFNLAAKTLIGLIDETRGGIKYASDPQPFAFATAAKVLRDADLGNYRLLTVPNMLLAPLQVIIPDLYNSLWRNSLLDPSANIAHQLPSDIYPTIVAIVRGSRP